MCIVVTPDGYVYKCVRRQGRDDIEAIHCRLFRVSHDVQLGLGICGSPGHEDRCRGEVVESASSAGFDGEVM